MEMPPVVIVVPCYNEAKRLRVEAFLEYARAMPNVSFLFVDDGSTDGTVKIIRKLLVDASGSVELMILSSNHGKAEAVRAGVVHALQFNKSAEWIGYLDADLAVPLEELAYLFRFADLQPNAVRHKIVFGCRVARGGAKIRRRWFRYYISRVLATLRSQVLPLIIYDTQCGAKFIKRDVAAALFAEPFVGGWLFDIEVFLRLHLLGKKENFSAEEGICEVPLRVWTEVDGSRTRLADLPMALASLWRISRHYGPAGEGKTPQKRINPS